jgi:gamma-glutamylcyclotransferase (GGCT)/AIG2-like uncharacterized protein YtfP
LEENYLFVYGTLMRGFENPFAARLRAGSTFVGAGAFPGRLYRVSWYPGAVYTPGQSERVHGEVYQLHDFATLIVALDEYEDVLPEATLSLYLRRVVPVTLEDGRELACWTYLYNRSLAKATLIPDGRFRG